MTQNKLSPVSRNMLPNLLFTPETLNGVPIRTNCSGIVGIPFHVKEYLKENRIFFDKTICAWTQVKLLDLLFG